MIVNRIGIAHSKHRNAIGIVGIKADSSTKEVEIMIARQWTREKLSLVSSEISKVFEKSPSQTEGYADQLVGENILKELKARYDLPLSIITTSKDVKNSDDIQRIVVMDKVEMTQLVLKLKQSKRIFFPARRNKHMEELVNQFEIFSEHKTEAGNIDYYAPGDEFDNLTKALMIACFSVRNIIEGDDGIAYAGPIDSNLRGRGNVFGTGGLGNQYDRDPEKEFREAFPSMGEWD